jgi:hypothetical protein
VHVGIPESSRAPRGFERSFDPVLWQWRPVSHAPPGGAEKPAAAQRQRRRDNGSRISFCASPLGIAYRIATPST